MPVQTGPAKGLFVDTGFFGRLLEYFLNVRWKSIPLFLIPVKNDRIHQVVPEGDILVILPDLYRHQHTDRVFLAVHHPLPEGRHGIAPVHVDRVGTELPEGIDKDRAAHHPQS